MNHKVLLGVVVVLTLVTAGIHGTFAANMLSRQPGGNRPPQASSAQQGNGQAPGGANAQGNGGPNAQGVGPNAGGNRPAGGFRGNGAPLSFLFRYLGPLFVANALGYLVLLALIALPIPFFKDHVALAHWLLITFAAVTFVAYFGVNGFGGFLRNTLALIAKPDEILLIVFTYLHLRAVQSSAAVPAASPASVAAS